MHRGIQKIWLLFWSITSITFLPVKGFGQNNKLAIAATGNLEKGNSYQVANYKPPAAKDGKDGDARFAIMLLRGAKRGTDGKNGKPGPGLTVHVSLVSGGDSGILKIVISVAKSDKAPDIFYINPLIGHLNIIADGGDAGNGGQGEAGLPAEGKRPDTDGGLGGDGGNGGPGGSIRVIFDSAALKFWNRGIILCSNEGGNGGMGGSGGRGAGEYSNSTGGGGDPGINGSRESQIIFEDHKGVIIWFK